MLKIKFHPLTVTLCGFAGCLLLITATLYFIDKGLPHILNDAPVPVLREGICISYSKYEFSDCSKIYKIEEIGKRNALLKSLYYNSDLREVPISHLLKVYGEVDCECSDRVKWK